MKKLSLPEILALGQPEQLLVRSLNCGIYRAELNLAGQSYILADNKGVSITFRSCNAIREFCHKFDYRPNSVVLHQNTTYGEMIGLDNRLPQDDLIRLDWHSIT